MQMILVANLSKPFDYNAKGNLRRNPILQRYAEEVEELYSNIEQSTQCDIELPMSWDAARTKSFIRTVVHRVLVRPVSDDADIFLNGCDR